MTSINGRQVAATTIGPTSTRVGEFSTDHYGQVLTCIWDEYVPADGPDELDWQGGYYASWAEPTNEEIASQAYQDFVARARTEHELEQWHQERIRQRSRQEFEAADQWRRGHPVEAAALEEQARASLRASGMTDEQIDADREYLKGLLGDLLLQRVRRWR